MSEVEMPTTLGDYELIEIIEQIDQSCVFRAVQLSIKREVILVLLHPSYTSAESIAEFRDNVRTKASVRQVNMGQILEIQEYQGYHFFTRQKISGQSLDQFAENQWPISPSKLFRILRSCAEAFIYLEENEIENRPLQLKHIFLESEAVCHLKNIAIAGKRDPQRSNQDLIYLGQQLKSLVERDSSGAGRAHTLLKWMRGEEREEAITWKEILKLCRRIDDQFTSDSALRSSKETSDSRKKRPTWLPMAIGATAIVLTLIIGIALSSKPDSTAPPAPDKMPALLAVNAESEDAAFSIETTPVSIGDYAEFLDEFEKLTEAEQQNLRHPEQPRSKTSYKPIDWTEMHSRAQAQGTWENHPISLDNPITYIDFWDAWTYAKYKSGRLPTEDEWQQTLAHCQQKSLSSPLAKNIREWTLSAARKPSFPMGPKFQKLITHENFKVNFVFAENRSLRSSDLSFRIVIPSKK